MRVPPLGSIRRVLSRLESLRSLGVRPVEPVNLHITLRFLGNVEEAMVDDISGAMKRTADAHRPFDMVLSGMGVFPGRQRIRVIWISARSPHLEEIASYLIDQLGKIGFARESFTPHLTVARVKSGRARSEVLKILDDNLNMNFGTVRVRSIELMKSTLTPKGPIYEVVRSVVLCENHSCDETRR